jgi:fibronectin-binding autotransporter adhesin
MPDRKGLATATPNSGMAITSRQPQRHIASCQRQPSHASTVLRRAAKPSVIVALATAALCASHNSLRAQDWAQSCPGSSTGCRQWSGANAGFPGGLDWTVPFNWLQGASAPDKNTAAYIEWNPAVAGFPFETGYFTAYVGYSTTVHATASVLYIGTLPKTDDPEQHAPPLLTIMNDSILTVDAVHMATAPGTTATLNIGWQPIPPLGDSGAVGPPNPTFGTLETKALTAGPGTAQVNVAEAGGRIRALANNDNFISGFSGKQFLLHGTLIVDTNGLKIGVSSPLAGAGVGEFFGTLSVVGGGTLVLTADNTYGGATTVDDGTLLVNGSIRSVFTQVNTGTTLGGIGTIFGDVINAGTVAPGASIGTLTVVGNYVGAGGTLAIETVLGDDSSATDQLVIKGAGHAASGMTGIIVINLGGPGALTTGNGIPIVVAQNGATTEPTAFALAKRVAAGPFEYLLFRGPPGGTGSPDAQNTWYLRSHGSPSDPFLPPSEPVPLYRPEVPLYSGMPAVARQQELTVLGTFHERNGDQRLVTSADARTAAWGRLFGQRMEQANSGHADASFEGTTGGLQSGLDVMQWVSASGHQDRFGLFAAHATTTGTMRGFALGIQNFAAGRAELDGTSFGGYWTHLAPSGWYTDTVLMGTRFAGEGRTTGNEVSLSGYGIVASVEGGYPAHIAPGLRLEPQAQLVFQHLNFDVNDPFGHVALDTPDALFGRLGVRLWADLAPQPLVLRPYLKANVWQDFTETDTIRFAGVHEIQSRHRAMTLELGGGVVAQIAPGFGLWASAEYTTDIGGSHDSQEGVRGTGGLRLTW